MLFRESTKMIALSMKTINVIIFILFLSISGWLVSRPIFYIYNTNNMIYSLFLNIDCNHSKH